MNNINYRTPRPLNHTHHVVMKRYINLCKRMRYYIRRVQKDANTDLQNEYDEALFNLRHFLDAEGITFTPIIKFSFHDL